MGFFVSSRSFDVILLIEMMDFEKVLYILGFCVGVFSALELFQTIATDAEAARR